MDKRKITDAITTTVSRFMVRRHYYNIRVAQHCTFSAVCLSSTLQCVCAVCMYIYPSKVLRQKVHEDVSFPKTTSSLPGYTDAYLLRRIPDTNLVSVWQLSHSIGTRDTARNVHSTAYRFIPSLAFPSQYLSLSLSLFSSRGKRKKKRRS